jgi:cobalt-zinc-cadmium efflux system membrane fusion protein
MTTIRRPWIYLPAVAGLAGVLALLPACGEARDDAPANAVLANHSHVGDEMCFICDPAKREAGRLWCAEHARYEDRCWECQPQLEDESRPFCEEHGLYEDECHLCNPSLDPESEAGDLEATSDASGGLFCSEHNLPETQCGICQPQRAASLQSGESLGIRMASARSAEFAGLTIEQPTRGIAGETLELLGEVHFNDNRRARVTPLAAGVLTDIRIDVGDAVEAGQVLAVVNSPEVAQAKSSYLTALSERDVAAANHERERQLVEENIAARRDLQAAEGEHRRAVLAVRQTRQQLLNLGFAEDDVEDIEREQSASSDLLVHAPFAGVVIKRSAALGEAVDREALFEVADLTTMWIELAVPEAKAVRLIRGGIVNVEVEALPGNSIEGEITWISPQINENTRMVQARATVPNPDGTLRHGMFAQVSASLETPREMMQVPTEAVQNIDGDSFVFVRTEPDLFDLRRVAVGPASTGGSTAILSGLDTEDLIVTGGSFTMRTEFLKSRLGAGCVDD